MRKLKLEQIVNEIKQELEEIHEPISIWVYRTIKNIQNKQIISENQELKNKVEKLEATISEILKRNPEKQSKINKNQTTIEEYIKDKQ